MYFNIIFHFPRFYLACVFVLSSFDHLQLGIRSVSLQPKVRGGCQHPQESAFIVWAGVQQALSLHCWWVMLLAGITWFNISYVFGDAPDQLFAEQTTAVSPNQSDSSLWCHLPKFGMESTSRGIANSFVSPAPSVAWSLRRTKIKRGKNRPPTSKTPRQVALTPERASRRSWETIPGAT